WGSFLSCAPISNRRLSRCSAHPRRPVTNRPAGWNPSPPLGNLLDGEFRRPSYHRLIAQDRRYCNVHVSTGLDIIRHIERDDIDTYGFRGVNAGDWRDVATCYTERDRVWRGCVIAGCSGLGGVDETSRCFHRT